MSEQIRRTYDAEFKRQAVHLSLEVGRTGYGLFKYIEVYHNRRRRHSSNLPVRGRTQTGGWKSPAEYEAQWHKMLKAA